MASTAPAKSQPLHNFTLPHLKWNKDAQSSGHHQRRRSIKSPSRRPTASSASPVRQSPLRESVSETPSRHQSPLCDSSAPPSPLEFRVLGDYQGRQPPFPVREGPRRAPIASDPPLYFRTHDPAPERRASVQGTVDSIEYQGFHWKYSKLNGGNLERSTKKLESKSKVKEAEDEAGIKRSNKILIKIPFIKENSDDEIPSEDFPKRDEKIEADETRDLREEGKINCNINEETKIWNLRPRKPIRASLSDNWGPAKIHGPVMPEKNKIQSPSRNLSNRSGENGDNSQKKGGGEKKRKLSVFVSLTKDEIEEDIFSLTGLKPARRPKKRAKNIQRQIDTLFPGAWLMSITADSYKV